MSEFLKCWRRIWEFCPNWKHYAIDKVECSCGEIYANNEYLKKHIQEKEAQMNLS